jgi:hypothetical protein
MESCRQYLRNWAEEENPGRPVLRGVALDVLKLKFQSQSIVFAHAWFDSPCLVTHLQFGIEDKTGVWADDLELLGTYDLFTSLDGEAIDDRARWLQLQTPVEAHLIFLRSGAIGLSKTNYGYWQDIQSAFPDSMTSLGPYNQGQVEGFMAQQFGSNCSQWPLSRVAIEEFFDADDQEEIISA